MEKKDKKQRDIVLSQDNALTTARYKFDLIEKRALYSIIRNIRAQYIENENGRRDLFDDLIITIHEEELKKCGDNTKMQNIYDALKRLRNRDIEINNEKMWLSIGFVNYVKHIKNKSYFEVQVSKEVLPYYVELAQNFTSYSMTVAIALKSTFSQRFYELCCQYRNAGFFFYTVEKLREMFMLERNTNGDAISKGVYLTIRKRNSGSCTMPDNAIYTSSSSQRATKARKLPNTNSTFTQGKPNNKSYWNTKAQNRRSST